MVTGHELSEGVSIVSGVSGGWGSRHVVLYFSSSVHFFVKAQNFALQKPSVGRIGGKDSLPRFPPPSMVCKSQASPIRCLFPLTLVLPKPGARTPPVAPVCGGESGLDGAGITRGSYEGGGIRATRPGATRDFNRAAI